jgi:peptidyl-prolyl isomerase G (cyclophilin G)
VVFGRVIRGYDDVVKKLSDVPVDGRDRPTVPILISNCGELQLRNKQPSENSEGDLVLYMWLFFNVFLTPKCTAKIDKRSMSTIEDSPKRGKRRSKRSPTPETGQPRRNKRKSKHTEKKSPSPKNGTEVVEQKAAQHPAETDEEYDVRLEREEKERLEFERKQELEKLRRKYADGEMSTDGVRFKGRGCVLSLSLCGSCLYLHHQADEVR